VDGQRVKGGSGVVGEAIPFQKEKTM